MRKNNLIHIFPNQEDIPKEALEEEGVVFYELLGDIAHIQDLRTGGNLVGAVNVGEPYHKRKEKVTCTQWYLFNDFAITPIVKVWMSSINPPLFFIPFSLPPPQKYLCNLCVLEVVNI